MEKTLYNHQLRFLAQNPDKGLLVWSTGTGKTLTACEWRKKRNHLKNCLVITPKNIKEKWKRDLEENNTEGTVLTYQEMKKKPLDHYDILIVDEAHNAASPLFYKQRSQISTTLYNLVKSKPEMPVLLLTATPIRSTPYNIHTLACYINKYWDIKKFREEFFYWTNMFGRWHWEVRLDWRKRIRKYVESISDIVSLEDCIDIPPQEEEVINIHWGWDQDEELEKLELIEPIQQWVARHRLENGKHKLKKLEEILDGYQKAIVICHYKSQIDEYSEHFKNIREVYVLDGRVKNQDEVIENAKKSKDCIFFLQAQMGAGFDASEFSVMIFASMSFRYIDMVQAKGRILRINNPHANKYYYLLGGKCDRAVYNTIMSGKDFDVLENI
jgi:superfamily II DNA or RNA helicase